jgi:hypothetical protein
MTAALAIWAAIQRIGAGALSFLGKLNIWQALLIAALLVAGVQTIRLKSEQRHSGKVETQLSKCVAARQADQAAFAQTVANYRAAAAQAEAEDKANAARVKAQQDQISKEQSDEYQKRIADARARAERLRSQGSAGGSNPGSPAKPGVSGLPAPAPGTPESSPDGLPLLCTEQGIQLDELIKWVERQAAVDPNTEAPGK